MCTAATMSPIDPTTANAFNPTEQKSPIPISVEDVTAYLDLAKGEKGNKGGFGLDSDEQIMEVFKALTDKVHPLALGNVKRVHSQIRAIARKLLELHISGKESKQRIERVVSQLTEELFSHSHLINRSEGLEIFGEDVITVPSEQEEEAIWELYEHYDDLFELKSTFNLKDWLGNEEEKQLETVGAVIETAGMSHVFGAVSNVRKISQIPQGAQIQVPPGQRIPLIPGLPTRVNIEPMSQGWYSNKKGV